MRWYRTMLAVSSLHANVSHSHRKFSHLTFTPCHKISIDSFKCLNSWTLHYSHPEPQAALCALIICYAKCVRCFVSSVYLSAFCDACVHLHFECLHSYIHSHVSALFALSVCLLTCEYVCVCTEEHNKPLCVCKMWLIICCVLFCFFQFKPINTRAARPLTSNKTYL